MKIILLNFKLALVFSLLSLFSTGNISAQTNTWDGSSSSNWNTAANWSLNLVPTSAHDVVIPNGITTTININTAGACKTFTMNGGNAANTVSIASGNSLTVSGAVSIGAGTGSGDHKLLAIGTSTLSCTSITISATGSTSRNSGITVSTGTVTASGSITMGDTNDVFTFSGAGLLKVGGNMSGGTFTCSTATVNYYGDGTGGTSAAQTIAGYTYNNLTTTGSGTKTAAANITVGNTVTVSAGTTLHLAANTLSSPTNLVLQNGTTGAVISGTGLLTLGGNVSVSYTGAGTSGATISCPVALGATRTFTVADDGTTATDLTINGIISTAFGFTKLGIGTVSLAGANTYSGGTLITSGALLLGNAGVIANASALTLNGGIFKTGSSTGNTETVGTLDVEASSTIAFGTGSHSLLFAASNGLTWLNTATLTITGWTGTAGASGSGGKIFVGNNASGLTATQLSQIGFSGYSCGATILSTGEIVPNAPTTAPTASAQNVCPGDTVADLTAMGTAIKWYATSSGGTALATSALLTTGTYYASQTLNNCESTTRTSVSVTVNSPNYAFTATSATNPAAIGSTSTITFNGTGFTNGTYAITYNLSGANTATATVSATITSGTGTFATGIITMPGATTITITSIQKSTDICAASINANNTAVFSIATTTYTTSGNFTVPTGVSCVKVEAWGAGAGGGSVNFNYAGGGGGGAYASSFVTVTSGASIPFTIGTGGAAAINGTNTTFNTNAVIAAGGTKNNGATGGAGGTVAASVGTVRYAGGNGGNGAIGVSGAGGGGAGSTGAGGNASAATAGTGASINGGNGGAGASTSNNGNPGSNYGGGGSGTNSFGSATGGAGANGLLKLTWVDATNFTTSATTSFCIGNASTVTITSSTLSNGSYTVTYNLSGANSATGSTASVTMANGTATFSTATLANSGNTTITITGITFTGWTCGAVLSSGNTANITVNPNKSAGAASATPTLCANTALIPITHTTIGATGIGTATGLPAGVTTAWASNTITISGTPTAMGTFNYSIPLTGGCGTANATGTIITYPGFTTGTITATGETLCYNENPGIIGNSTIASGGSGLITYKWQANGVDIPNSNAATYDPPAGLTTTTTYTRFAKDTACNTTFTLSTGSWVVTINPISVGGSISGATSACSGTTSGVLTLSGETGSVIRWESSVSPFTTWTSISNTATTYTSGILTQTTKFRAVVKSGSCAEANATAITIAVSSTTWSNSAWSNGTPTATTTAILSSAFTSNGTNLNACSLTVNNNAVVIISSGDTVTLNGPLTVASGSSVTFNNNANLVQSGTTNGNSGAITVKRNTSALKRQDYTIWSSPVSGQQLQAFSPQTLSNRFYTYNTTTNLYDEIGTPSGVNFATAKGYLIRVPNNHPTTPTIWTGQFQGVPNNGNYSFTLTDGGVDNRFNLVGNPYPSPIDAYEFVNNNNNRNSTSGTLYFWRKTNNAANPSYCVWTMGGFVSNGEAQVYDPNDVIQTGQGFFVEGTGVGTTVDFDNSMRVNNHANQFFKNANGIERNRIWLNATNSSGLFSQTMVGYIADATQGYDPMIDGKFINNGEIALTSLIGTTACAIQGRALPFDVSDIVPISFKATNAGNYTIAIDHVDGLFSGSQAIYLRDTITGIVHDLHTGGYNFTSEAGVFDSRFELVYQSASLGVSNPVFNANQVVLYKGTTNNLVISSGVEIMVNVKIFDLNGRLLTEKKEINSNQTTMDVEVTNEVVIVQITSDKGVVVTKKFIAQRVSLKQDKFTMEKVQVAEDE